MGVKDLNILFSALPSVDPSTNHPVVIIDGSNLIFQTLTRQISRLKNHLNLEIKRWNSIDMSLIDQLMFIIQHSIQEVSYFVRQYFNKGAEDVFIVVDPLASPSYPVNTSYKYNHKYESLIGIEGDQTVVFNIKSEEQELRRKRSSKSETISNMMEYINDLKQTDGLSDDNIAILKNVFIQSFLMTNNSDLLKLSGIVWAYVKQAFNEERLHIINAIDEADLVIKNVANDFPPTVQILVVSMDTDYLVLFSDMPNVNVTTLSNTNVIKNPFICWNAFLTCSYQYEMIVRIAAILGNDYTVHEPLISCKNYNDIISLLNIHGGFDSLRNCKRKKISKVLSCNENIDKDHILTVEELDDIVFKWNDGYFKKYYLSCIIYENWNKYGRYTEMENQTDESIDKEIRASISRLLPTLTEENANLVLYEWNAQNLYVNWKEFFESVRSTTIDSLDSFMSYFYEKSTNAEVEEGAEFL